MFRMQNSHYSMLKKYKVLRVKFSRWVFLILMFVGGIFSLLILVLFVSNTRNSSTVLVTQFRFRTTSLKNDWKSEKHDQQRFKKGMTLKKKDYEQKLFGILNCIFGEAVEINFFLSPVMCI